MKRSITLFLYLFSPIFSENIELKPHELWWTKNAPSKYELFKSWLGDINCPSRVAARNYIKESSYKTMLDVPCGTCTEYQGLINDGIEIDYHGLDITDYLVRKARFHGISADRGSIEHIPYADSSFDLLYVRHILEHLEYYEKALSESIRVAKKEVMVIFFKRPNQENDHIDLSEYEGALLYHNRYNKDKLAQFILKNPKVDYIQWESLALSIDGDECILHIYLLD